MPNLNLYIPDREITLWDAARRVATKRGISLGRLVTEALANDLPRAAKVPTDPYAHITADAA